MDIVTSPLISEFNGSVETSFFGLDPVNVSLVLTNDTIASQQIVRLDLNANIYYLGLNRCYHPDRDLATILNHSIVAMICFASFLLQLSLFRPFWRMAKSRGPAFYILLNMLFSSSANIMLFVFLLYLEGAIGFRLPIYYNFDYYIKQCTSRGEAVFYFTYVLNRCYAVMFPFSYSYRFTTRNVFWLICIGWLYNLLDRIEYGVSSKGFMGHVHCLAPGDGLGDGAVAYRVVKHPWMKKVDEIDTDIYFIIWYGPMVMDALVLVKLLYDKYTLQCWRQTVDHVIVDGRNERIRLFIVCLATTIYHFFWAYLVGGYSTFDVPLSWYNYSYIFENAMPYILMLFISRDIRTQWKLSTLPAWCSNCRGFGGGSVVRPQQSGPMYPNPNNS